jgi:hypothetical protein
MLRPFLWSSLWAICASAASKGKWRVESKESNVEGSRDLITSPFDSHSFLLEKCCWKCHHTLKLPAIPRNFAVLTSLVTRSPPIKLRHHSAAWADSGQTAKVHETSTERSRSHLLLTNLYPKDERDDRHQVRGYLACIDILATNDLNIVGTWYPSGMAALFLVSETEPALQYLVV